MLHPPNKHRSRITENVAKEETVSGMTRHKENRRRKYECEEAKIPRNYCEEPSVEEKMQRSREMHGDLPTLLAKSPRDKINFRIIQGTD